VQAACTPTQQHGSSAAIVSMTSNRMPCYTSLPTPLGIKSSEVLHGLAVIDDFSLALQQWQVCRGAQSIFRLVRTLQDAESSTLKVRAVQLHADTPQAHDKYSAHAQQIHARKSQKPHSHR
jgi:hypothetical protein